MKCMEDCCQKILPKKSFPTIDHLPRNLSPFISNYLTIFHLAFSSRPMGASIYLPYMPKPPKMIISHLLYNGGHSNVFSIDCISNPILSRVITHHPLYNSHHCDTKFTFLLAFYHPTFSTI